jgi:hypothetical protein
LTLRVGINTGEVVIGAADADLIGDALNVAARLEKACRPGSVLVGEETWRLTRNRFGYEPLGEVTVAGRDHPVSIYEVAAASLDVLETASPFVGRNTEMARLRSALDAAIAERSTELVTVIGAQAATDVDAMTFEVRCDRAGSATFTPIAQLIRDAAGLDEQADPELALTRVQALFAEDDPDRGRLAEILAGLLGAAGSRSVEETFWAIRQFIQRIPGGRPMVIVIDDIQWAESLLLDLLEHLAEWQRGVALLLVALARPELREVRPSLVEAGRRLRDVVVLDGLDAHATEQLAAGLLGTDRLPSGLVARLPTSTDGNPLFLRELVRMLVDDRVIEQRDGQWELTIDADAVEVPPTIQSLLASRVERLPSAEREVLELASVIGVEFSLGALRDIAGAQRASIPATLEQMRRKDLVEPIGTYWGDEPVHRFHHVLIRDAAYRRLLKATRADLHARVAAWTDRTAAQLIGEHETTIAFHYEQAHRYRRELGSVDDEAQRLGQRGAELLSTAAARALGRDDLVSAGSLATRALGLLADDETTKRIELLVIACESLLSSGDATAGRPLVEQLHRVAADDAALGAWSACFEAQLIGLTEPQRLLAADKMVTAAAEVMDASGDDAGRAKAHQVRAGLLSRLGRVGDAEAELDVALAAARRANDRRRVSAVLGEAPVAALWGPSPVAKAGGRCLDVVRVLRITTASPSVEATSTRCQAVLEALRGRNDIARQMIVAARATLEDLGLRHDLLETDLISGVVPLLAGEAVEAIPPLRSAYEGLRSLGAGPDAGYAAALLSRALLSLGRVDEADGLATEAEALAGQNLKTAIAWRIARAEVWAARGDHAVGLSFAEAAVEIAAATDLVLDHGDACSALARLCEAASDADAASAARAAAIGLYELKGATIPIERLAGAGSTTRDTGAPLRAIAMAPHPTPVESPYEHAVVRRMREFYAAGFDGNEDALTRFAEINFADDYVRIDHRRGNPTPPVTGRAEFVKTTLEAAGTFAAQSADRRDSDQRAMRPHSVSVSKVASSRSWRQGRRRVRAAARAQAHRDGARVAPWETVGCCRSWRSTPNASHRPAPTRVRCESCASPFWSPVRPGLAASTRRLQNGQSPGKADPLRPAARPTRFRHAEASHPVLQPRWLLVDRCDCQAVGVGHFCGGLGNPGVTLPIAAIDRLVVGPFEGLGDGSANRVGPGGVPAKCRVVIKRAELSIRNPYSKL